jgi:hypothetical protein
MKSEKAFDAPTISAVLVEIAALREQFERLAALIEERLPPEPMGCEWMTVEEASAAALRAPQTITTWCRRFGVGVLTDGRWRVDRAHLRRLMINRHGEGRLPPGLQ